MSISTYSELRSSIGDFLNREDLTAVIPTFIDLTEAKLRRRYKDFSPLSDGNTSNWILADYPDVYLYGALMEAAPYLHEDERVNIWAQLYAAAISTLKGTVNNADFDDYAGLKLAIGDWLGRADFDGAIPQLIKLAEAKIMRDLRHWRQQRRVTTTLNEQFENLPSDFLQPINFYIDTNQGEKTLEFSSLGEINRRKRYAAGISGEPVVYTINSGQIEFIPTPDDSYPLTMVYYAKIPNLSSENTVNWLLTYYPDIYLYGSLMQASSYLGDDQRIAVWSQLYGEAVGKANQESEAALYSGPLVLRNK